MKPYLLTFLFTLPLFTSVTTHQPLFPATSSPPPETTHDNPFFHEHTPDQPPSPPPPPPATPYTAAEQTADGVSQPPARKSGERVKIVVVVLVGVVSVIILWGFVFYVYKYRLKKRGGNNDDNNNNNTTTFRYVGAAESPITAMELGNGSLNGSPYYKLNGVKLADRYRPSPELQPLPPLSKLKLPKPDKPRAVTSDYEEEEEEEEEESHGFFTPHGSILSTDDGVSVKGLGLKPVYYSKKSSPRSRFSVSSSPETMLENCRAAKSPAKQPPAAAKVIPKIIKQVSKDDDVEGEDGSKPKLGTLHLDKLEAISDGLISSFRGSLEKEETRKSAQENQVLDPKKSHNIARLLRELHVTQEEVCEALVEGNAYGLGAELLETLVKMAPTNEEEIKLKDYSDDMSKLGSAERFLKTILDIPFAFRRLEALLYQANFENEVKYLRSSFQTLEAASEELKNSKLFLKLLEAVLQTGNRMNVGPNLGEATAFKLDTLLKLVDIKGIDGKTALLHFAVQEMIRSEGMESNTKTESNPACSEGILKKGLQISSVLNQELGHVKKAAGMDSHVLSGQVSKLELGLQKIQSECHETQDNQGNFYRSKRMFAAEAETELKTIKIDEKKALASVKDVTEYFHGDSVKEGVYPLRIFMIVRDFMGILDDVCKEVGQMHDGIMVETATSFKVPISDPLPNVTIYKTRHSSSSDEERSYSSTR